MEIEKVLDKVLYEIYFGAHTTIRLSDRMPEIYYSDLLNILKKLKADGLIDNLLDDPCCYHITTQGKMHLDAGGYKEKTKKEEIIFQGTIAQTKFAK